MNRRKQRESALKVVYTHLVTNKDMDTVMDDYHIASNTGDFIHYSIDDPEIVDALYRVEERSSIYITVINTKLKSGWEFYRLGRIEQSILLLALAELEQSIQEKPVIVNEAVELAKQYADEDSFKLINGVLDSL
jgi:transcription antitermination protein NusB